LREGSVFGFLLTLLILDGIILMVAVLLQSGKGGGLASMGGMGTDSFIGGRQAANLLTKTSWTTGGVFLTLALVLSILSSRDRQPKSILREEFQQGPAPAAQPVLPGTQPQPGAGTTTTAPATSTSPAQPPAQQPQP
jgi:preprotein translocase subunit SecG